LALALGPESLLTSLTKFVVLYKPVHQKLWHNILFRRFFACHVVICHEYHKHKQGPTRDAYVDRCS